MNLNLTKKVFFSFCLLLIGIVAHSQVPDSLRINVPGKPFYHLLLNDEEIASVKKKIHTDKHERYAWSQMKKDADNCIAHPVYFPKREGAWGAQYIDPETGRQLIYDINSPNKHLSDDGKKVYTGTIYDECWNSYTMLILANRMYLLASVALITRDSKYANALKTLYLDLAYKYNNYRIHDRSFKVYGDGADPIAGRALSQSIDECNFLSQLIYSYDALLQTGILDKNEHTEIQEKLWGNASKMLYRILILHPSGGNWWMWHSSGGLAVGLATHDNNLIRMAINNPTYGVLKMLRSGYLSEDGLVEEHSPSYQVYAMMAISRTAFMSKRAGISFDKIPVVQKAFSSMLNLSYPNLSMPRINDSRVMNLTTVCSDLTTSAVSNATFLDLLNIGWSIYHSRDIMNAISYIHQSAGKMNKGGNEMFNIYSLLYGPAKFNSGPLRHLPAFVAKSSGLVFLRAFNNNRDWCSLFKNTYPGLGHAHSNDLHISGYANGDEFIASFGSSEYAHYSYLQWYVQSLASNTIVINTLSQKRKESVNTIDWAVAQGAVKAVRGSAQNVQDDADKGAPVKFSRTTIITPLAFYDFCRVDPDNASKKLSNHTDDTIDYVIHFNNAINWEGKLTETTDVLAPATPQYPPAKNPYVAYHLLTDVKKLQPADLNLTGIITEPNGSKVQSVFFHPDDQKQQLYNVTGLGYENDPNKKLPLLIQRTTGTNADFGAIFIPYKKENPYLSANVLYNSRNASAILLKTKAGAEVVFEADHNKGINIKTDKGINYQFQGDMGVVSDSRNGKTYILKGRTLSDDNGRLEVDTDVPVSLTVSKQKVTAKNLGDKAVKVTWYPAKGSAKVFNLTAFK